METVEALVEAARALAATVRSGMSFKQGNTTSLWWAEDIRDREKIRARGTAAIDFLRVHAGSDSDWYRRAASSLDGEDAGRLSSIETRVHFVGDVLEQWAEQVELGYARPSGAVVGQTTREVATTDLMEQVRVLVADKNVHPAAPIVLAGAALEVALRGAVEAAELTFAGNGSIGIYGKALRAADLISKQDMKDIESMAGLRNAAAHGDHDELSRERAGLMEQQVNMLLAKLGAS